MFKLLRKYYSINKIERRILNQTFFWLIYAFLLARFIPLRWFNKLLGEFKKVDGNIINNEQLQRINEVLKNLRRIKRRLPWKVKCFEEAIVAKKILEKFKIKSTIYLGVAKGSEESLIAHAWLKSGNSFITGERGYNKFTIVGFYS